MKAQEGQYGHDHNNQADEIDNPVHGAIPDLVATKSNPAAARMFPAERRFDEPSFGLGRGIF